LDEAGRLGAGALLDLGGGPSLRRAQHLICSEPTRA
jgi:hypothetical protein